VKLKITVDNKTYEVDVEAAEPETGPSLPLRYAVQPTSVHVPAKAPPPAQAPAAESGGPVNEGKVCRSPISGVVVRVDAKPGQTIKNGDVLLVLEAMKMETNITAPVDGKVAKLNVSNGDSVKNG
jgi:methylmalonyl-CoA carboxyltransferase small subunit